MGKGEGMASYLTKKTQVRDELAAVGEVIGSPEMTRTALNGDVSQASAVDRICSDYYWQEEHTHMGSIVG